MLNNQKPSGEKLGLGFNSFEASSSGTKEIKFVKAQKKASSDGGPINIGGPLNVQAAFKANMGPPPATTLGSEKSHTNLRLIQSLTSKELVRNLTKLKFDQHFCDACKIGKQAHTSHKAKNIVSTTRCLELLHMDLFGPSVVRSYGGNRYTLVIGDDYSSNDDVTTTPSPTTASSSPTPPNLPSKTPSTNQTSSSQENTSTSFQSKLQISPPSSNEPTSPQPLNPLLDNISDVPPRPLNPQPL
ncbi:hypothetical protein Tco_0654346 [Tanacetum coccineum]|uniref:GAG-pre-integrase domain-containing protein n=1 Tax=Tanacetum coccineum TaxID=301880 RepID=A0ABQ4X358_9ASTR